MKNTVSQKLRWFVLTTIALSWLAGCAGMDQYLPAETPKLTAVQEGQVGEVVEARLLQLLGGQRHDQTLAGELASLISKNDGSDGRFTVSVADRSDAALYALPGGRVVMTRGILSGIGDMDELSRLLQHAGLLARKASSEQATRASIKATSEILSSNESVYDPEAASIRLARFFARRPCEGACLAQLLPNSSSRSGVMPEAIRLLRALQPAYQRLEEALQFEKAGNPSQAIALYLEAATMAPEEPQILGSLGMAYLRAGEMQTARLNLQKAVRLQPDYYKTRMGLGYLYLQQGKVGKANDELAESVRLLPVTENLFLLAEAREKSGDAKGGIALYRLVVEKDPHSKLGRTAASRLARLKVAQ